MPDLLPMKQVLFSTLVSLVLVLVVTPVDARSYVSKTDFLESAFNDATLSPTDVSRTEVSRTEVSRTGISQAVLWLNDETKQVARHILGHPYRGMRVRYWISGERMAWILDEIGKDEPITIGVVTEQERIRKITILDFRETRGGEVRYDFFTGQYVGVGLDENNRLDKHIDGITGATLSVWAVTHVAELALYLSRQVMMDLQLEPDIPSQSSEDE
jgi:hypothetical protein